MSADISGPLRELRDALRNPIPDVDSFVFLLSSTLQALHLHPTSVPPDQVANEVIRSINRFLPAIQVQLVTSAIPIFIAALDGPQRGLLETFFVPPKDSASGTLPVRRTIALTSYATLTVLLSTTTPQGKSIPLESREYVLSTLGSLADEYSIDQLYWAVWSSSLTTDDSLGAKSEGLRTLRWEEAVKAGVGLPAKVANAVGRWMADRWSGDIPADLVPR
jgi:telomere length regulation protein